MNSFVGIKPEHIRADQLTNMLRCPLCKGLYRLAHTIFECGHTFCYHCILQHIKSFRGKNPAVKCPQCHQVFDSNHTKSLFRDNFKQCLVDQLAPQYAETDSLIIDRAKTLFPKYNLQFITKDYQNGALTNRIDSHRIEENSEITQHFADKVQQKLGMCFQQFTELIISESEFVKMQGGSQVQPQTIDSEPKTQRDFKYVGIEGRMKVKKLTLTKLIKFLQKKALMRISETSQIPHEWMNENEDILNVKIGLQISQLKLQTDLDITQILNNSSENTVMYSIEGSP